MPILACGYCQIDYRVGPRQPSTRCAYCSRLYCPECSDQYMSPLEHQPRRESGPGQVPTLVSQGYRSYLTERGQVIEEESRTTTFSMEEFPVIPAVCEVCLGLTEERYNAIPALGCPPDEIWSAMFLPAAGILLQSHNRLPHPTLSEFRFLSPRSGFNIYGMSDTQIAGERARIRVQHGQNPRSRWKNDQIRRLEQMEPTYLPQDRYWQEARDHILRGEEVDDLATEAWLLWRQAHGTERSSGEDCPDLLAWAPTDLGTVLRYLREAYTHLYPSAEVPLELTDTDAVRSGASLWEFPQDAFLTHQPYPSPETMLLLKEAASHSRKLRERVQEMEALLESDDTFPLSRRVVAS